MAKQSLQDKFQITVPYNPNDDSESEGDDWVWPPQKALRARPLSGAYSDGLISDFSLGPKFQQKMEAVPRNMVDINAGTARNSIPRRTDIQEWANDEHGGMALVTAADSDVTDSVMQPQHLRDGFTLHDMANTDDQYTGEGVDHFYGDAEGQDDAGNKYSGFVERNNYLDRN